MENEEARRMADAAAMRDVRAAAVSIMPLLEEALGDAQEMGIHPGSIQEWCLAKFGVPLSELCTKDAAFAVMHVNKLIIQKRQLMEAQRGWDETRATI